jgi:ABC-2 type transport system ATP-binding protein
MKIHIEQLRHAFGSKTVLNGVSFDINDGEIFSLIGPNGAGKTTTLRCIYGDLVWNSGRITLNGQKISGRIKEKIAVVTENRFTFSRFTGEDYVKLWKSLYPGWNEKVFGSFSTHYNFDLAARVDTYSMGWKTLLNLALAMSSGADLMILDEPTQNLDPLIRQEMLKTLHTFVEQEGKTILVSSHEIFELEEITSSFAILKEGDILYTDQIDNAKENHRIVTQEEKVSIGQVIGLVRNETLIKTQEEVGRYPTFQEIVLGYLQGKKSFLPFSV